MILGGFYKIPDAVLAVLQAGSYSLTPIWQRRTIFYFDDIDDSNLQVVVAPVSRQMDENTRASKSYGYRVGAFVLQKLHATSEVERQTLEDGLLMFVDELQDKLNQVGVLQVEGKSLGMVPPTDDQLPFNDESYRQAKRFLSVAEVQVYDR